MNTGEKIESAGFPNSVIENLERRFAVLEQCKNVYNFTQVEREYIDYIDREKRIHPILKSLAIDAKYYDVITHLIFVFSTPSEGQPEIIKIPSFLNGSQFQDINWGTIKAAETKRRAVTNEIAHDAVVGCGSRERANIIWTDITLQGRIFLPRKLHYDLTERLRGEIGSNMRADIPKSNWIEQNENAAKSKTTFQNGVLRCGDKIHAFHRGQREEKIRILFFKLLWDDRRLVKNRNEKIIGTPRAPLYFAVQLHLTTDSETFAHNKKPKNQLFGLIKGINRILKQKGFPARIERKGSIQLVITER